MFHAPRMFHASADVPRVGNVPRTGRRCTGGSSPRIARVGKCSTVRFADEDCNQQLNPRIFAKLIPRFKGASGAGGLLLNTKASQEAACSRAPDAIVPDQEPESHDAGVSRLGENGSHLEAGRMPQRATQSRLAAQVAAETPESAHTWWGHRSQTRLGCRLAFQVAVEMPEQAHTWRRWMPQRAMRGRWKGQV